jgi:hypothetical protein
VLALLALGWSATVARADEDEARWSARPIAGVALTTEAQADPALAFAQGASASLAYGVTDRLDLGAEFIALRAEPSFDASIPVEDVIIRGPFIRRISSASLLLGPTWRLGRPAGWTPVLGASAGGGLRYRSIGMFSEYRYMPPGKAASRGWDLIAAGRAGVERRINRRWTFGAYASLAAAWGPDVRILATSTLSLGLSYAYYPRWRQSQ